MKAVMIIPTGIGCEIGGHSGDATPSAKLLASVCDTLIVHPNVVNASDINEMTENMLYVEGSMLDDFLEEKIGLKRVKSNKILVVINPPLVQEVVDAVSAARVTIGADVSILVLETPLIMSGDVVNGEAIGTVEGWKELIIQAQERNFDALAINTFVSITENVELNYYNNGGANPWGKVEAITSRLISNALGKPVAHAPLDIEKVEYLEEVDPRIAPEMNSVCNLHCVLKGLHKAPQIGREIFAKDIDCLVSPKCYGRPHKACERLNIPIIYVEENQTIYSDRDIRTGYYAENYLEVVGILSAMRIGVSLESVRRPIPKTCVIKEGLS